MPNKLDLYVAAKMRRDRRLLEHIRRHGIAEADLLEIEAWADSIGVTDASFANVDLVEACFGKPAMWEPGAVAYALELWPDHYFRWSVDSIRRAAPAGFSLRVAPEPWAMTRSIGDIPDTVRPWYHTMEDVRTWFGPPAVDESWGHLGDFIYGPIPSGELVVVQADFGLVTSIHVQRTEQT